MTTKLCYGCKHIREIAHVDPLDRGYCIDCVKDMPVGSAVRAMQFLTLTIPFLVGDRVHAYTAGEIYDGVGTVTEVSIDVEHGGTPVYPTFRVTIDQKSDDDAPDEGWYTECCLRKVTELVEQAG